MNEPSDTLVRKFVAAYDADGGVGGEANYVVGHLLGRLECALCEITHGPLRREKSFDEFRDRLGVPFDVVHRNERGTEVESPTGDALPSVHRQDRYGLGRRAGPCGVGRVRWRGRRTRTRLAECIATEGLVLASA